ncbi:cytochrome C [Roseivivax sp. GX 12232]|uniref:c-type cytochrome n=1 Tax=Roseivivax sp. GX 12232 TaxID=2900547 RepID=UPI001E2DDCD9|nr:cytochrome C [Roseivivax sp. GX 12232]MCE0506231.1 cytochrome C [Roseivivax sp. GX 12232]
MTMLRALFLAAFLPADLASAQEAPSAFAPCAQCHSVTAPDGTRLVAGGRTGPNLYGVMGRPVAGAAGFNYSRSMQEARARGLTWDRASFAAYLKNPTEFLQGWLGDPSARARMAYRSETGAGAIYDYLRALER